MSELISNSPLPTPVRLSIRPPTPPRTDQEEIEDGISAALQLLTEHLASSSPVKPPTPLAATAPHLDTPPSSPTRKPIRPSLQHRSVSELRRVRFGSNIIHADVGPEGLHRSPLRPLPPSRSNSYELVRPILKPRQDSPTPIQPPEPAPKHRPLAKKVFKSLEKMLEYVIESAAQNAMSSRFDAYFTLSKHLKEFKTPPDWDLLVKRLPRILVYLRRDILADECGLGSGSAAADVEPSLQRYAVELLAVLLGMPGSRDAISPARMTDIIHRSVKILNGRLNTAEAQNEAMRHILLLSRQRFNALKDNEIKLLLTCLHRPRSIWKQRDFRRHRLKIYENLAGTLPVQFAEHASLWIDVLVDQLQNALGDTAESTRRIARSVDIFPGVGTTLNRLLLSQSRSSESTVGDHLRASLQGEPDRNNVIKAWAAISTLLKTTNSSKKSALHDCDDPFWVKVIQGNDPDVDPFGSEAATVSYGNFVHAQGNVFHNTTHRRDFWQNAIFNPLVNASMWRSNRLDRASLNLATCRYSAVLHHAFRPSLSDTDLDKSWAKFVAKDGGPMGMLEAFKYYPRLACGVLQSLFATMEERPYTGDRLLQDGLVTWEDIPSLRSNWILSRFPTIVETIYPALLEAQWVDGSAEGDFQSQVEKDTIEAYRQFSHTLFRAIQGARRLEITVSTSTRNMMDSLTKLLERWRTPFGLLLAREVADTADEILDGNWRAALEKSVAERQFGEDENRAETSDSGSRITQQSLKSPLETAPPSSEKGKSRAQAQGVPSSSPESHLQSPNLSTPVTKLPDKPLGLPQEQQEPLDSISLHLDQSTSSVHPSSSQASQELAAMSPQESQSDPKPAGAWRFRTLSPDSVRSHLTTETESTESSQNAEDFSRDPASNPEAQSDSENEIEQPQEISMKIPDALPSEDEDGGIDPSLNQNDLRKNNPFDGVCVEGELTEEASPKSHPIEGNDINEATEEVVHGSSQRPIHEAEQAAPVDQENTEELPSAKPTAGSHSNQQASGQKKRNRRTEAQILQEAAKTTEHPPASRRRRTGDSKQGQTVNGRSKATDPSSPNEALGHSARKSREEELGEIFARNLASDPSEVSSVLSSVDSSVENPFVSARNSPHSSRRSSLRHAAAIRSPAQPPQDLTPRVERRSSRRVSSMNARPMHQDGWAALVRDSTADALASQEASQDSSRSLHSGSSASRTANKTAKNTNVAIIDMVGSEDSPTSNRRGAQLGKRKARELDNYETGSPQLKRNKTVDVAPVTTLSQNFVTCDHNKPDAQVDDASKPYNGTVISTNAEQKSDVSTANEIPRTPEISKPGPSTADGTSIGSIATRSMRLRGHEASASKEDIDTFKIGGGLASLKDVEPELRVPMLATSLVMQGVPLLEPTVTSTPASEGIPPAKSTFSAAANSSFAGRNFSPKTAMSPPNSLGNSVLSPKRAAALKSTERIAEQYADPWHKRSSDGATGSVSQASPRTPRQGSSTRLCSTPQPVRSSPASLFPNLKAPEPLTISSESPLQEEKQADTDQDVGSSGLWRKGEILPGTEQALPDERQEATQRIIEFNPLPGPDPKPSTRKRKRDDEDEMDRARNEQVETPDSHSRAASPREKLNTWFAGFHNTVMVALREKLPQFVQSAEGGSDFRAGIMRMFQDMAAISVESETAQEQTGNR